MKKNACRIISLIMIILAIVAFYEGITVTGSGFLDLSNIARYVLIVSSVIIGIVAVATGIYGW